MHFRMLLSAFNIAPGEGLPVALLLGHSFFMGLAGVLFYTAASAVFLAAFSPAALPYVYIASAGFVALCGFLYARIEARTPVSLLLPATLVLLVLSVVAWRLGLWLTHATWLAFGLLLWLRVLVVLTNLVFWGLAGRLFNVRQGKRLFSLIGSGELAASILGGFATPLVVPVLGTHNLLLGSACSLVACLGLLLVTLRRCAAPLTAEAKEESTTPATPHSLTQLLQQRYVVLIFLIQMLLVMVYYFVDFTFLAQTKAHYQTEEQLANFLGPFLGMVETINFLTSTLLSSRLITRYGLRVGLLVHPIGLMGCSVLLAVTGTTASMHHLFFWLTALTKICDEVLWKTINDPVFLILYQPLPAQQRFAAQIAMQGIMGPFAVALSGAILVLFGTVGSGHMGQLPIVILVVLAGAVIVALKVQREYASALKQALTKRTLEGTGLSLHDPSSLAVLQRELQSPYPGEVIYALELLEKLEHPSLPAMLVPLLEHTNVNVRQDVLRRLERLRATSAMAAVRHYLSTETTPQARATAVQTLCALGEVEVVEEVMPYLNHAEPQMRIGAMVGLLRYGGIEGVLVAGERLLSMVHASDPALREMAAQVLGEVGLQSFYQPLAPLLQDSDPRVCRAALLAAGKVNNARLWPFVLPHLSAPTVARAASMALAAGGEAVLPVLAAAFAAPEQPRETRLAIAQLCGRIRGEQAIGLLRAALDVPDDAVRSRVLAGLSMCGYHANTADVLYIEQHLQAEVAEAAWTLATLVDIEHDATVACLHAALSYHLGQIQQRLFWLLSFLYDPQAILRAQDHLTHGTAEKRAYAVEIIDVLVAQHLKTGLLPLLDEATPAQRVQRLQVHFPQSSLELHQRLQDVLTRSEGKIMPWIKVCALYCVAECNVALCLEAVKAALADPAPHVRETALWALSQLAPAAYRQSLEMFQHDACPAVARVIRRIAAAGQGEPSMLLTIEKVLILKTVSIFAETPEEILAEVAAILEEVEVQAGETILHKDDVGRCMYIIVDGRVRIHNGDHVIAYLGARDIFGELAVLDAEPRSASATVEVDTQLFRLDQDALYELMTDRFEVARGIIRVLCRRVRVREYEG
jgi:ATP/ADP translocase/HEAT repeat protein